MHHPYQLAFFLEALLVISAVFLPPTNMGRLDFRFVSPPFWKPGQPDWCCVLFLCRRSGKYILWQLSVGFWAKRRSICRGTELVEDILTSNIEFFECHVERLVGSSCRATDLPALFCSDRVQHIYLSKSSYWKMFRTMRTPPRDCDLCRNIKPGTLNQARKHIP
jgi:hypothetical protein